MILNPSEIKALVRSRTVKAPHSDLVLSAGVSICASPKLDILGAKFDSRLAFEDHVCGIVSCVPHRICIFEVGEACLRDTSICCFVATMHLFSQSLSIVLRCGGLLLNVIFSLSSAGCIR